jgi:hypothetical protein
MSPLTATSRPTLIITATLAMNTLTVTMITATNMAIAMARPLISTINSVTHQRSNTPETQLRQLGPLDFHSFFTNPHLATPTPLHLLQQRHIHIIPQPQRLKELTDTPMGQCKPRRVGEEGGNPFRTS